MVFWARIQFSENNKRKEQSMKKAVMILGCLVLFSFAGCAFLEKLAPSQVDEQGASIPGTHELTPLAKDVSDAIPYGGVATSVLLLAWNFVERAKSSKTTAGLMSTIRAIEAAAKDPETQDAIAKLKLQLAEAHRSVNVQPLVNRLLAKIKFTV